MQNKTITSANLYAHRATLQYAAMLRSAVQKVPPIYS